MDTPSLSCDVLIVGGGPAGLSVAAALPDDVSSVIVHQDQEIGRPVRTSGGSWLKDVERLGILRALGLAEKP
jgi:digeranylgeranylglycerophospholipid reductase